MNQVSRRRAYLVFLLVMITINFETDFHLTGFIDLDTKLICVLMKLIYIFFRVCFI